MANNIRINNRVGSTLQVGNNSVERAYYGSSLVYTPSFFDEDAITYIDAVESADGQELEVGVKVTINNFVSGCKADGNWDAIKASCILAGARTLNGALVPLKGPAPTNFNFVSADYDRKTGLKGDKSTKYLNSNRNASDDDQTDVHMSVFATEENTGGTSSRFLAASNDLEILDDADLSVRSRINSSSLINHPVPTLTGFFVVSRDNSDGYDFYAFGAAGTAESSANRTVDAAYTVFARPSGDRTDARLSFYSIGSALDTVSFRNRVSTLMTEIEAALT